MKKALIVGGSNGIGLAVVKYLIELDYFVEICDIVSPDDSDLDSSKYRFTYTDLIYFNDELFFNFSQDKDIELLLITAGIGRVADFQFHHLVEIDKIVKIDTISTIKIIKQFYNRIMNDDNFYTGVFGSVAGWVSSPYASVYSAAKAGVVKFIESVNAELEYNKSENRILDISPTFFDGSHFYGKKNNTNILMPLAKDVVSKLLSKSVLFFPNYDKVVKRVLDDYHNNPHKFSMDSLNYKRESGRYDNTKKIKIGCLLLSFTHFSVAQLDLIKDARRNCDYLIADVEYGNKPDSALIDDKIVLESCKYIDKVIDLLSNDLREIWKKCNYDILFIPSNLQSFVSIDKYKEFFNERKIEIIYLASQV